jgi:hypothetical protein
MEGDDAVARQNESSGEKKWSIEEERLDVLEPFLQTLAAELELEGVLKKDKEGRFCISLTPELLIFAKEEEERVLLSAHIAPLPTTRQEEVVILLMKANFLGQGTGGAAIGLEEDEKFLTLSAALTYDMNYKLFKLALEHFANFLAYWQGELTSLGTKTS